MQKPGFIREINGIRVIAALIVLGAHYSTVSGLTSGISLFFVITGFLSGRKIKRAVADGRKLNFLPDLQSTLWRLLLPMHLVLLVIAIWVYTSIDVLHRASWLKSIFAMSLGYGNYYEISNATTYWNRESILSPTLSLWAMSVLVQFAIILAVVRFVVSRVAPRISLATRQMFLIFLGVAAISLGAFDAISFDGTTSYHFSTTTWIWAFLTGLVLGGINWQISNNPTHIRIADFIFFTLLILGTLPVIGIEPLGTWIRPAFGVIAAICLLAPAKGNALFQQFLNSKPMQFLGDITFGIYLWHWPLLIAFRHYTDVISGSAHQGNHIESLNQINLFYAIALTLVSILLAWISQKVIDLLVERVGKLAKVSKSFTQLGILAIVPVLVFVMQGTSISSSPDYYKNLVPALAEAKKDSPSYIYANCQRGEISVCLYGDPKATKTIAIVGTSTAGQWYDAAIPLADKYGWKLEVIIKEGCTHAVDRLLEACNTWRDDVAAKLIDEKPDLVVMEATHANQAETLEAVSYLDLRILNPLNTAGIPVMGIRTTPRFDFMIPECIAADSNYETACGIEASDFFLTPAEFARDVNPDQFVEIVDLTSVICPNGFCSPVDGNIIRYVDDKHFTATYSKTLSDELEPFLLKALG